MNKKDRLTYLTDCNHYNKDYNQQERRSDLLMVGLGHPYAEDYKKLRAEYDKLKYACNSGTRYIVYGNEDEHAMLGAPRLSLARHPIGLRGFQVVYPASPIWTKYLNAAAKAGWPEGVEPAIECGKILVVSKDAKLLGLLFGLSDGKGSIQKKEAGVMEFIVYNPTMEESFALLKAIRQKMKKYLLPERTLEDDMDAEAELPLSEKKLSLANVQQVTVTARKVLVPLIPLGDVSKAERIVKRLIELAREGFNYEQVRSYLVDSYGKPKIIAKQEVRKLDKEFGYKATVV